MKRLFFAACVLALLFSAGVLFAQDQPGEEPKDQPEDQPEDQPKDESKPEEGEGKTITWEANLDGALEKAKKNDAMIMIFFYIDRSEYCTEFEKRSINQSAVVELSEKFVCLKVNKNKEKDVATKFQVSTVPMTLFITADKKMLGRVVGYVNPEPFAKKVKEVYESIEIEKKTREILRSDPEDLEANLKLGKVYIIRELRDLAIHCLKKVVDGDPKNKKGLLVEAAFTLGKLQHENGMFAQARDNFKKVRKYDVLDKKGYGDDMLAAEAHMYMKENELDEAQKKWLLFTVKYPKSELMPEALFYLGGVYWQTGKNKEAIEAWEKLVKDYPNSEMVDKAKSFIQTLKKQMKEGSSDRGDRKK